MIWASNNKWGSKLRQKQAPQKMSTPRLLPPTWASAAESPEPQHQGRELAGASPSPPLGLSKGVEHGATAGQWPCEPRAAQRVNLHYDKAKSSVSRGATHRFSVREYIGNFKKMLKPWEGQQKYLVSLKCESDGQHSTRGE